MKIILKNTKLEFQVDSFDVDEFIILPQTETDNPEFQSVIVDNVDKVLWGRFKDGSITDIDLTGLSVEGVSVQRIVNAIIEKYNL